MEDDPQSELHDLSGHSTIRDLDARSLGLPLRTRRGPG